MVLLGKLLDKLLVLVRPLERFNIHVIKTDLLSLQTNEYTSTTSSGQKQKKNFTQKTVSKSSKIYDPVSNISISTGSKKDWSHCTIVNSEVRRFYHSFDNQVQ
jgi:hypothetical protein